jgi:cobalt/nickel transport system permease protein
MGLNNYTKRESPVHSWDARWKCATLIGYIFACAFVTELYNLIFISGISITLLACAKLPLRKVMHSLKPLLFLLLIMFPVISLTAGGTVIYSYGIIKVYKEGLLFAGTITIRAISIVLVTITLFGSTKFSTIMKVGESFRVPSALATIFLFTYRYIFLYLENLHKLLTAARLRGYRLLKGIKHIRNTVGILVTLLIRSYEQSERAFYAMQLRGFSGSVRSKGSFSAGWQDVVKTGIFIILFALIIWIEVV